MAFKIISAVLLIVWLTFVLRGKGGFAHMLLLITAALLVIDAVSIYRRKMIDR